VLSHCCLTAVRRSLNWWISWWIALASPLSLHSDTLASNPRVLLMSSISATSKCVRRLGITIDNTLSFSAHVDSVCKAANYHVWTLRHIRKSVTTDVIFVHSEYYGWRLTWVHLIRDNQVQCWKIATFSEVNQLDRAHCNGHKWAQPNELLMWYKVHYLWIIQYLYLVLNNFNDSWYLYKYYSIHWLHRHVWYISWYKEIIITQISCPSLTYGSDLRNCNSSCWSEW